MENNEHTFSSYLLAKYSLLPFLYPRISLPCSQEPPANIHFHHSPLRSIMLSSHMQAGHPTGHFPTDAAFLSHLFVFYLLQPLTLIDCITCLLN